MKLIRDTYKELESWYDSPLRNSPLILFGARQVGKSTLASDFAASTGREIIEVNFWKDKDGAYKKLFENEPFAPELIKKLEVLKGKKINQENSILVIDEIQECPQAYTLSKSFKEDTSIPVIATGSYLKLLLGTYFDSDGSNLIVPVGCTHEKLVTPISFKEYLRHRNEPLYEMYRDQSLHKKIDDVLHKEYLKIYYEYLFVGGMPEAVTAFLTLRESSLYEAIQVTREIQKGLISGYQNDFLTFKDRNLVKSNIANKLNYTFHTIAKELEKYKILDTPVKRFRFKSLGKNAEYRRLANVFDYLSRSGLIIKSHVVRELSEPFINSTENAFKCFYFDVGVLNAQLDLSYESITNDTISSYKGFIAESFVAQELYSLRKEELLSWSNNRYQIEFIYKDGTDYFPIEVKSSKKSVSSRSLTYYCENYQPKRAYKVAPRNFGMSGNFYSLPIYLLGKIYLDKQE